MLRRRVSFERVTAALATVPDRLRGIRRAAQGRFEPLRERLGPVQERIDPALRIATTLGWVAMVAGVIVLWIGLRQGWIEFQVLGALLVVVIIAAGLWTLGRSSYDIGVELDSTRVTVGDQAMGRVQVRNKGRRSLIPARIELPVGSNVAAFDMPSLGRDALHEELFLVPTRRRAVVPIGPVMSVRGDPVGLMRREQRWTDRVDLFVHPRTVLLASGAAGFLRDVEGVTTSDLSSSDVSFHALRDYVPGDDRRAIHWRSTARLGRLIVRQFEETRRAHLLVALSLEPNHYADPEDFETAVSTVGSLAMQAIRDDRRVDVSVSGTLLRHASGPHLLDLLSGLALREGSGSARDLVANAYAQVPGASVVAIVAGGSTTPADLRAGHVLLPADVAAFAVRAGAELAPARRKVSTLTVLDISHLDDLPRAVRTIR